MASLAAERATTLKSYGDYPPMLQDLNFVRDAYQEGVPYPLLIILPDYALTRLAKFAPDFWDWRSGIFLFKTTQETRQAAWDQAMSRDRTLERIMPEFN